MSALTKVFVVLLVLCSLMLSAAVVVFVNRTEDYAKIAKNIADKAAASEAALRQEVNDKATAWQTAQDAAKSAGDMAAKLKGDLASLQTDVSKREAEIADLKSKMAMSELTASQLTAALKASEDQKALQGSQIVELRSGADKFTKSNGELNLALSDASNKLDVMTRQYRYQQEQLAQNQSEIARLSQLIKDNNLSLNTAPVGIRAGAPAINGVVRAIKNIDNIPYATISVGSSDNVAKGMEFKVIDRDSGTFLGLLTVESVEPNEATGRLAGPKLSDIKAGAEVRTQL